MRKIARKALTASAVAATAVALTAMPASASPITTVTIQNGGYITGTNMGSIIGFGNINGSILECTSSTGSGYTQKDASGNPIVNGTANATGAAVLGSVSFSSPGQVNDWCVANGSIPTEVKAVGTPWTLDVTGSTSGGVTPGRLNGVQVTLHGPSVLCDATVGGPNGSDGYIDGTYTNPSTPGGNDGTLTVAFGASNNLRVLSVTSGCTQLVDLGETVSLAGTYNVVNNNGSSPTINQP